MRVVSLAPTATETIAFLGALNLLTGVTEDCDFPEQVRRLPTYGSWASPDLYALSRDRPDLVCTFGGHQKEMALWLQDRGLSVFHSDPPTVEASLTAMMALAKCLQKPKDGARLLEHLRARLRVVDHQTSLLPKTLRPKILRIMQWHPLITVGPGAFQYDVIQRAGGIPFLEDGAAAYEKVSPEQVVAWNPDIIFFCEPSIKTLLKHDPLWQFCSAIRRGSVFVFPCALTCRAGPRIVDMTEQLAHIVALWFRKHKENI
ncbi:MAG: helical backbone metal receptor [Desulfosoma sp.]